MAISIRTFWIVTLACFATQRGGEADPAKWSKPNPTAITCSGSLSKGCGDASSVYAVLGSATVVNVDAGWIEGQITVGAVAAKASMLWTATPAPAATAPLAKNYEGILCTGVASGSVGTSTYVGYSDKTVNSDSTTFGSQGVSTSTPPANPLTPISIKPDPSNPTSPNGLICAFAFSVSTKLAIANYSAASPLTLYLGVVKTPGNAITASTAASEGKLAVDAEVTQQATTITVAPQNFLTGWTWYYKGATTPGFLGQVFGRSVDSCTDDCVAVRLEQVTDGIRLTVRARLATAVLANAEPLTTSAAYTVALTNDVSGTTAIGFGCNVGDLNGASKEAAAMTVTPLKFAAGYDKGAIYNTNITATSTNLWNPYYAMVECGGLFPVVGGMTDIIDWTAALYVVYKTVPLNTAVVTTGEKPNVGTLYSLSKMADATAQGYHQITLPFKVTKPGGDVVTTPKPNGSVAFAASRITFVLPLITVCLKIICMKETRGI